MKKFLSVILVLFFLGCLWQHNPEKAKNISEDFLNALYIENNISKAYQMCDEKMRKIFGTDFLENTLRKFKERYNVVERFIPEAYFFEAPDRYITIFFSALSEKGVSYHKVILEYDKKGEYKIISTFFLERPFDGYRNIRKF